MTIRSLCTYVALVLLAALPTMTPRLALAREYDTTLTGQATILGSFINGEISAKAGANRGSASSSDSMHLSLSTNATVEPLTVTRTDLEMQAATSAASAGAMQMRATDTTSVTAEDQLRAHALATLSSDANISSVSLSSAQVAMSYYVPAKLFGLIRVSVPLRVAVDATGSTTVSYPWYGFLLASDKVGLSIRAEAAAKNQLASTTVSGETALSAEMQMRLLSSLSAVLESQSDANVTNL